MTTKPKPCPVCDGPAFMDVYTDVCCDSSGCVLNAVVMSRAAWDALPRVGTDAARLVGALVGAASADFDNTERIESARAAVLSAMVVTTPALDTDALLLMIDALRLAVKQKDAEIAALMDHQYGFDGADSYQQQFQQRPVSECGHTWDGQCHHRTTGNHRCVMGGHHGKRHRCSCGVWDRAPLSPPPAAPPDADALISEFRDCVMRQEQANALGHAHDYGAERRARAALKARIQSAHPTPIHAAAEPITQAAWDKAREVQPSPTADFPPGCRCNEPDPKRSQMRTHGPCECECHRDAVPFPTAEALWTALTTAKNVMHSSGTIGPDGVYTHAAIIVTAEHLAAALVELWGKP